jgi:hypothetical protein
LQTDLVELAAYGIAVGRTPIDQLGTDAVQLEVGHKPPTHHTTETPLSVELEALGPAAADHLRARADGNGPDAGQLHERVACSFKSAGLVAPAKPVVGMRLSMPNAEAKRGTSGPGSPSGDIEAEVSQTNIPPALFWPGWGLRAGLRVASARCVAAGWCSQASWAPSTAPASGR